MLNKVIRALEGRKTIIGAVLIGLGTAPISIPVAASTALVLVGTALGGAGVFDKARRYTEK